MVVNYRGYRWAIFFAVIFIIPLGYWLRFASLGFPLLQDVAGSLAYQMLLMFLVVFCLPRVSLFKIAVGVFVASSLIEILQLSQFPLLQAVRATWAGRVILGNTFSWTDFPPYAVGSWLGWMILRGLRRRFIR